MGLGTGAWGLGGRSITRLALEWGNSLWYDPCMEIEYVCEYDGQGRLKHPWPWEHLDRLAIGDTVRIFGFMSDRAVRTSASKWGLRRGGRIGVRRGDDTLVCTLERESEAEARPVGRRSKYPVLRSLKPGEAGLIPWLPRDKDQSAIWRAIAREREKGKRFVAQPMVRGVHVERLS